MNSAPDMSDPLIEAAVRPLHANAEQRLAAAAFLQAIRDPEALGGDRMISRWNAVDVGKRKPSWRWVWVIVLVTLFILVWGGIERVHVFGRWGGWSDRWGDSYENRVESICKRVASRMTPEQRVQLFGDDSNVDLFVASKVLWEMHPDEPSRFAQYVHFYMQQHNQLPEGFLETARRIDPDNAWFIYLAAVMESKDSVSRIPRNPRPSRKVGGQRKLDPMPWSIQDTARHTRSLELIHEAGAMSGFRTYHEANLGEVISVMPMNDLSQYLDSAGFLGQMASSGTLQLRSLRPSLSAAVWQAGENGDLEQYTKAKDDWLRLIRHLEKTPVTTVLDELAVQIVVSDLSKDLVHAAAKLGMNDESEYWKSIDETRRTEREEYSKREFKVDGMPSDGHRVAGGFFGAGLAGLQRLMNRPPPVHDKDLQPGRMIDHELWSWVGSCLVWLLMGVMMLGLAFYRYRVAGLVQALSKRFESLLESKDWMWILGAGVILPFVYVMAINRFTPFGGHAYSVAGTYLLLPLAHFVAWALLCWIALGIVIRMRIARRAMPFRFKSPGWLAWVALISTLAFVPMIGWSVMTEVPDTFWFDWIRRISWIDYSPDHVSWRFRTAIGLLAVPVLWLLGVAAAGLIGGKNGLLIQAVTARAMIRGCAFVMFACAMAAWGFQSMEQHWFNQETPMKIDPKLPAWSRYEYQSALQMRKEFREMFKEHL
jgi:hypothetical protein